MAKGCKSNFITKNVFYVEAILEPGVSFILIKIISRNVDFLILGSKE